MIERVGFTNDVPAELARLDAMVLPSLFGEGLPMVVLEAMAAAVPVIATRVEGTPEAVTDGVEGLLAEPNDSDSLAAKIRELVSGQCDWQTMAEAAFSRHARDFSDRAMAEENGARLSPDHELVSSRLLEHPVDDPLCRETIAVGVGFDFSAAARCAFRE